MHTYNVLYVEICHKMHANCIFQVKLTIFYNAPIAPKRSKSSTRLRLILLVRPLNLGLLSLI